MYPIVYENINRMDYIEYKKWVGGNIRVSVYVMYKVIYVSPETCRDQF